MRMIFMRVAQGIKKLFKNAKSMRILLFVLSGALACTAGVYAYGLWQEGVRAEENAQEILRVSGFADLEQKPAETGDAYTQPQAPAADPNALDSLFDSVLDGYSVVARLDIPSIGITLPVLSETTNTAPSSTASERSSSPSACQARSLSTTSARSSSGSIEKALSTPPSARRRVKCFSITVAPSATLATATPMPSV